MGRAILSVIVGYLVMFVVVFATLSVAYLAIGTEGAFRSGSYAISGLWIVVSIVLSFIAAVLGGLVCASIARRPTPPKILAAVVLALGLALAIPVVTQSGGPPAVRTEGVGAIEAMQNAKQPAWIALLNPLIGALGVLVGASRLEGRGEPTEP